MKTFIYALCDPITEEIRYIGKTNTPWEYEISNSYGS
jgi:hypothetical protein